MFKFFLSILLLLSPPAFAEMSSLFGSNPKTMAMGSVSLFQGKPSPYQVYSAPAALGYMRRVEVGAGGLYMDPRLRGFGTLVLNSNGTRGDFKTAGVLPGGGSLASIALPLGLGDPVVLGGAIFLPFSSLIRVSGSPLNYPYYPLYSDVSRNFSFVLGAGYELFDGLALGVNFRSITKSNTFYTLRSDSSVNYSANATEAKSESQVSFSVVYDNARRNPEMPYSVGAMYRAKAGLETRIAADVTAFVPVQGEIISMPAFSPEEWVLMASARLGDRLTLGFDGAWVRWSAFNSPYGAGNINTYIFRSSLDNGFKDIPVIRFGADYGTPLGGFWLKELSLRGGYLFHPSPVPDQTGDSNFVDNDRHSFSAGLGLALPSPTKEGESLDLDLFVQYNWLKSRQITKASATNIGAPGYKAGGHIMLYGLGATCKF